MNNVLGVEVKLLKDYSLLRETLERIGIKNNKERKFYPSCYCLDENNTYRIYHFKELFIKEGKESSYDDLDELRRNTILFFLKKWGFIESSFEIGEILVKKIDVLKHEEKKDFKICHKYFFKRKI